MYAALAAGRVPGVRCVGGWACGAGVVRNVPCVVAVGGGADTSKIQEMSRMFLELLAFIRAPDRVWLCI